MMNNHISWNLILLGFIHNFSSYDHFRGRGYILPLVCFRLKPFLYSIREPKNKQNNMGHLISRQISKNFKIWYSTLILLYLSSLILYREVFVLKTELWVPLFKWNVYQHFSMFVAGKTVSSELFSNVFLSTPFISSESRLRPYSWIFFCLGWQR